MPLSLPFLRGLSRRVAGALGLLVAAYGSARAQAPELHCLMQPIEPAQRAHQAALVVEAQVLDAQGFWNASHTRLFTRHRLRVFSLLKGQVADTTGLVLVTEGGRLGLDQQVLTNTLQLAPGQQGVFFLTRAPWSGLPAAAAYTPYASQQGFIEFNPAERTAAEPFRTYPALDAAFFKQITNLTGQPRQLLQANPALAPMAPAPGQRNMAPTISGFSPQRLPAGTGAVLTITGDGFGNSRGAGFVEFRNADDGGSTRVKARAADYLSWTNNRIDVRVPSAANGGSPVSNGHPAGSGTLRITTSDQSVVESASAVTIGYALTNVENTDGTLLQRPNHIALNATGGISFRFGPNFTTSAAASWQRALATWRCQTGMNWDVAAANPSNAIADDGQNVVAFDAGADLPAQVLGRTTSYYRGCYAPSGEVVFWVKEIDMQFDDATNFQFGPALAVGALGQIDFESVAVHELGHAQQLTHLILPGAVMHYAVARGQNTRTLSTSSDVAGGRQVLRVRSFRQLGCGGPALLPAPLTSFAAQYAAGTGTTLSWATRDECFLSSFAVERSLAGDTAAWTRLATVAARPPAAQYQYVDAQTPGGLHYYRLRLLRPDGTLDNVAPALITTEGASATASIFPNPVTDDVLRLQYPAAADGAVVFRIYDRLGRRLSTTSTTLSAGLSVVPLNVASLIPGLYILRWQDAQGKTGSRRFVRY
ncbi:T9SS type A sorting domain-containing protein [Hymenobacter properus]|uniref:T9SS type A sorting domain-containing protein n=1 Tax=Hymenobacter properus TaxID=2791026 RepID=A0A931BFM8_9BACT|nr:T9SS type A sorting domain-containing protein [Hymenobacter properus]MBF9141636.1 T9SS type A sorting domain-containing protein [Hymenobacter properus]MBR7720445.1 T9SS type A sorting domain-containing protein [Microvirga sp. SRT04]